MADFSDALDTLLANCSAIRGAAFTDLDGEDIAVEPREARDALRICAAFGGLALKRLAAAEQAAGRPGVSSVTVDGADGRFFAFAVGDNYQLVLSVAGDALQAPVTAAATKAVAQLRTWI